MLDHVQRIGLPYTLIDVGWWYQVSIPRVPSGRFDYAVAIPMTLLVAGGEVPSALTDLRDVGMYVAKIIGDDRTLNKKVLAYTEVKTQNEIFELVEKKAGEKPEFARMSGEEVDSKIQEAIDSKDAMSRVQFEYVRSWGVRGDNTPDSARYLGYLITDDLYPGCKGRTFETYLQEVLDGKATMVHKDMKARLQQTKS